MHRRSPPTARHSPPQPHFGLSRGVVNFGKYHTRLSARFFFGSIARRIFGVCLWCALFFSYVIVHIAPQCIPFLVPPQCTPLACTPVHSASQCTPSACTPVHSARRPRVTLLRSAQCILLHLLAKRTKTLNSRGLNAQQTC